MIVRAGEIRALGFDWPGSKLIDGCAVKSWRGIDLDATLRALERNLEFHERELREMYAFQRAHNADWGDVSDHREDHHDRVSEGREAVQKLREIIAAVRSSPNA